jgi:hypothetical protein
MPLASKACPLVPATCETPVIADPLTLIACEKIADHLIPITCKRLVIADPADPLTLITCETWASAA